MQFDLLLPLNIVHVREFFDNDDFEAASGDVVAPAVDMVTNLVRLAIAPLPAIRAEVFQQAVVVTHVTAIARRAGTAAVDFVARAGHVTRASWARMLAVLTVCAVVTELETRRHVSQ